MLSILDRYIARVLSASTLVTLTVFAVISAIIKFVEQMKFVGRGNYDIAHVSLYVFYGIPRDIEIFFPMSALIGGLVGIGMLASNSELIVMQAAGLSRLHIIKSVMKAAAVLMLCNMIIGEWVAPAGEAKSKEIRSQAMSGGSLISSKNGVWAKDGDDFVHIAEVENSGTLRNIQVYRFNERLKLTSWISAESATYLKQAWLLQKVTETTIGDERVIPQKSQSLTWQSSLTPEKLGVVAVKPEALSIRGLIDYLAYLKANQQNPSRYQLAFWRKVMQPLTVAVMLLVALSFIFGPLRSVSMGARIMMGVVTGLLFFIANEIFGSVILVYEIPAFIGAVMPSLVFMVLAVYLINRKAG